MQKSFFSGPGFHNIRCGGPPQPSLPPSDRASTTQLLTAIALILFVKPGGLRRKSPAAADAEYSRTAGIHIRPSFSTSRAHPDPFGLPACRIAVFDPGCRIIRFADFATGNCPAEPGKQRPERKIHLHIPEMKTDMGRMRIHLACSGIVSRRIFPIPRHGGYEIAYFFIKMFFHADCRRQTQGSDRFALL